ncbi:MAG: hypothetical protein P8M80_04340 [Pirellulaceae bacterium]|nr:hypothetical protein [Pirellulaceae bacterium]
MRNSCFSIVAVCFLVASSLTCGFLVGNRSSEEDLASTVSTAETDLKGPSTPLKEILLKAETAASGNKISMATASIDGNIDIVFALDFESGNLFAWLPGTNQRFLGEWSVNVATAVGLEKGANPDLVMTVGNFNVKSGASGAIRTVPLICYIANGENGRVAGFGFQWNPQLAKAGNFQSGALIPVYQAGTREQIIKRQ